jgi:hypothetical protein
MTNQVNDHLQEGRMYSHVTVRTGGNHQEEPLGMAVERKHRTTMVALKGSVRITVHPEEPPVKTLTELRGNEMWTIPNCKIPKTGQFMKVSPSTTRATWAEIRTTKHTRRKKCRTGGKYRYQVCAFSNHTADNQAEEEEGGQRER